jgi:hypothetical protein
VLFVGVILASPTKPIENLSNDSAYSVTVLQINAKWNKQNAVNINKLHSCNIEWAYLEDQNSSVKKKFAKVPFIIIKKNDEPLITWEGNIMFEPTVTLKEIQDHINSYR